MHDVLILYRAAVIEEARTLKRHLTTAGLAAYISDDDGTLGEFWREEVFEKAKKCQVILLVFGAADGARFGGQLMQEAQVAMSTMGDGEEKQVVPVAVGGASLIDVPVWLKEVRGYEVHIMDEPHDPAAYGADASTFPDHSASRLAQRIRAGWSSEDVSDTEVAPARQSSPAGIRTMGDDQAETVGSGGDDDAEPALEDLGARARREARRLGTYLRNDGNFLLVVGSFGCGATGFSHSTTYSTAYLSSLRLDVPAHDARRIPSVPSPDQAAGWLSLTQSPNAVIASFSGVCDDVLHRELDTAIGELARESLSATGGATGTHLDHQVVVTSRLDDGIERALMSERVPFVRVVLDSVWRRAHIDGIVDYEQSSGTLRLLGQSTERPIPEGDAAVSEFLAQELRSAPLPCHEMDDRLAESTPEAWIIFKPFGSLTYPASCVHSSDSYLRVARRIWPDAGPALMPEVVKSAIQLGPALVLGCTPFDPDFRFLFRALLDGRLSPDYRHRAAFRLPETDSEALNDLYDAARDMGPWAPLKQVSSSPSSLLRAIAHFARGEHV